METFERAIAWVAYFSGKGTQRELNLFGVGEPTLNPKLPEMIKIARENLSVKCPVHTNTNGKLMTKELAIKLKQAGINHIDITGHNARDTAKCIRIFREVGIDGKLSVDYMTQPNNWAGQVDWFVPNYEYPCPWLHNGQVMVMWNGDITRCCIDAFATGVIGNVYDNRLDQLEVTPFRLCQDCHSTVPGEENKNTELVI